MIETAGASYTFTVRGEKVVIDYEREVISLPDEGKEFAVPHNLYNFCVVLGSIIYPVRDVTTKTIFVTGKPNERKHILLKKLGARLGTEQQEDVSSNGTGEKKNTKEKEKKEATAVKEESRRVEKGLLKFTLEAEGYEKIFILLPHDAFAFWELFRKKDKTVGVDDLVLEKRDGFVFVSGIPVHYQKTRNLFYVLDHFLRTGQILTVRLEWDFGRIDVLEKKRRIGVYKKAGEDYIPAGVVRLTPENALRIMSVL